MLPNHVVVSPETLREIAERHGLGGSSVERLPETGIFNQLSLWTLPCGATPVLSRAERPVPMLLEVLRFFMEPPDDRWRAIGPVEPGQHPENVPTASAGGNHA